MVVTGAVSLILGAISFANSLVGEGWTRYLIIVSGFGASNLIGDATGFYLLEGLTSSVPNALGFQAFFGVPFSWPLLGPVSTLLLFVAFYPIYIPLVKDAFSAALAAAFG